NECDRCGSRRLNFGEETSQMKRRADDPTPRAVKTELVLAIIAISLIVISAPPSQAAEAAIEQMPAKLETQFALSALPRQCRTRQPFIFSIRRRTTNFPDRE